MKTELIGRMRRTSQRPRPQRRCVNPHRLDSALEHGERI